MRECLQFITRPGDVPEHTAAAHSQDPTGARSAHGDEVIADALACKGVVEHAYQSPAETVQAPVGSMAWRRATLAKVGDTADDDSWAA